MKGLVGGIVVIAEIIIRFDNADIANLRGLQNLSGRFRASHIRRRADRSPFIEGAADPKLRPKPDQQRHANEQQPIRTETKTVRVVHKYFIEDTS